MKSDRQKELLNIISSKVITIKAGRTASIPIKAPKGNILKDLNYIFKPSEFKLGYRGGFAAAIMKSKITYILIINNINYNIIIPRH